ncbi:unnamed protein product [Ixodes pacificus]
MHQHYFFWGPYLAEEKFWREQVEVLLFLNSCREFYQRNVKEQWTKMHTFQGPKECCHRCKVPSEDDGKHYFIFITLFQNIVYYPSSSHTYILQTMIKLKVGQT